MSKLEVDSDLITDDAGTFAALGFTHLIRDVIWEAGQAIDRGETEKAREILRDGEEALDEVVEKGHSGMRARRKERSRASASQPGTRPGTNVPTGRGAAG